MNLSLAVEDAADELELACLYHDAKYLAWSEVLGQFRCSVSDYEAATIYAEEQDHMSDYQHANAETSEVMLGTWIEILNHRTNISKQTRSYPFKVSDEGLSLRTSWNESPYVFQLLVSQGRKRSLPDGTSCYTLFEELSAAAAGSYLGVSQTAVVFGAPRRDLPSGFRDAVNELVKRIGEGNGCANRPDVGNSKDDGLDIVAWKEFPDKRPSKLILFGQCATGKNWKRKIGELDAGKWCKRNLTQSLAVDPIRAFFVARDLSTGDAAEAGLNQILLDRCRIAALTSNKLSSRLNSRLHEWITTSVQDVSVEIEDEYS